MSNARVNLAPEVYQNSQRNKQRRKVATTVAAAIATVGGGLIVFGFVVLGGQVALIATYTSGIKDKQQQIASLPNLQQAVTTQKRLDSWQQLQKNQVYTSKFYDVWQKTDPQGIALNSLTLDAANKLEASGQAKTYALVTKLAKALEAANLQIGANSSPTNTPYFTGVTIAGASSSGTGAVDFKLATQVASEVSSGK